MRFGGNLSKFEMLGMKKRWDKRWKDEGCIDLNRPEGSVMRELAWCGVFMLVERKRDLLIK